MSSPVVNAAMGKRSGSTGHQQGFHTSLLLNALPSSVTVQMVDMSTLAANHHLPIKAEFMEAFNNIYAPSLPPLVAMPSKTPHDGGGSSSSSSSSGGGHMDMMDTDMSADLGALDDLPPLEECIFPSADGEEDESWDFAAALEMIFESDKVPHA